MNIEAGHIPPEGVIEPEEGTKVGDDPMVVPENASGKGIDPKIIHHERIVRDLSMKEEKPLREIATDIQSEYDQLIEEITKEFSPEGRNFVDEVRKYTKLKSELYYYQEEAKLNEKGEGSARISEKQNELNERMKGFFTRDEIELIKNGREPSVFLGKISNSDLLPEEKLKLKEILVYLLEEETRILNLYNLTDTLTGAKNRRGFSAELGRQVYEFEREKKPFVFVALDVNKFKIFNDNYGHDAGDRALMAVVDTLKSVFREGDVVGRVGGDEIYFMLSNTTLKALKTSNQESGISRLEKMLNTLDQLSIEVDTELGKRNIKIKVSCGFEEFNGNMTRGDLVDRADYKFLMGQAKPISNSLIGRGKTANVFAVRDEIYTGQVENFEGKNPKVVKSEIEPEIE